MVSTLPKLWTYEDLDDLPEGRVEIVHGVLQELPVSGSQHTSIAFVVGSAILQFVRPRGLGMVGGADGAYIFSRDPLILLVPDVSFVSRAKLPEITPRVPEVVPDLVVEVVSPIDRMHDVAAKVALYQEFGVSLVWVVLPSRKVVWVFDSAEKGVSREYGVGDELDGGAILPGFRLPLAEIFD